MGGAKVAVPAGPPSLDKSQPGSSQHALPPKEEPRSNEKEKVCSEEVSLESVAIGPMHENVQIKQDPLVTAVSHAPVVSLFLLPLVINV